MSSAGQTYGALPISYDYDPVKGVTKREPWKGTQTELESLVPGLRALGYKFRLEPDNDSPLWSLIVEQPDVDPVETWTLKGNDLEKSLWEHQDVVGWWEQQGTLLDERAKNRKCVEDYVTGGGRDSPSKTKADFDALVAASGGADNSVFAKIAQELVRGHESYVVSQWILRHTITVGWMPYGSKLVLSRNTGKVFRSTAAMVIRETVPVDLLPYELPEGEWLKRSPDGDQSGTLKWRIDHEYWWAEKWAWPYLTADQ
jgi:hypothetical protein